MDISDRAFANIPPERVEEMSREDTIFHELSHSVHTLDEDKESVKRLGRRPETIIAEAAAESISRGLAKGLIAKGRINYTPEQYIAVTIVMPLQVIKERDPDNEYFKAAVYVLDGMFERGIIEFNGSKIRVIDINAVFDYLEDNARKVISLYEDTEMTEQKAGKWVSGNCVAGQKLQELIDFIKSGGVK